MVKNYKKKVSNAALLYTARTVNAMHKTEREIILIHVSSLFIKKETVKVNEKREMSIVDKMLDFMT